MILHRHLTCHQAHYGLCVARDVETWRVCKPFCDRLRSWILHNEVPVILLRVARRDFRTEACFFVAWKRTSGSIVVLARLVSESGNAPIMDGTTLRFCTEEAGANDVAQGMAFALVSPAGVARQSFTARQEARDDTVVRQIKAHRVTTQTLDLHTRLLVTAVEPDASAILLHDAAGS